MHKAIKPSILAAALALLAAALPAFAQQGSVKSIDLYDFNHNGKIDRAVIAVDNPSQKTWMVHGTGGVKVWYGAASLNVAAVFIASQPGANPAKIEVVLDESDSNLPRSTAVDNLEIEYVPAGLGMGIDDGSAELPAIAKGDTGASDTENDKAGPILLSSTPVPGAFDVLRDTPIVLSFSEPIIQSTLAYSSVEDAAGWDQPAWSSDSKTATLNHAKYGSGVSATFTVTEAKDAAGNSIVLGSVWPNPFTFKNTSSTLPIPQVDNVFALIEPHVSSSLIVGAPNVISWYGNQSAIVRVKISYSSNGGASYTALFDGPAASEPFVWYPPNAPGTVQMKLEGFNAQNALVNLEVRNPIMLVANPSPAPFRIVSGPRLDAAGETTATISVETDMTPQTVSVLCNGVAAQAAVTMNGYRPAAVKAALSGLTTGSTYNCQFRLTDAFGNIVTADAPSFVASTAADMAAPVITDGPVFEQFDPAARTARIRWTTDEPSTAEASYGILHNYGGQAGDAILSKSHGLTLANLTPGAMHQVRITSIDAKGNAAVSKDYFFIFLSDGARIKGSGPAVYWHLGGKRFVFPNETIYRSWFADFYNVMTIPDSQLSGIPIGGNVRLHAGTWMVKITSDPKVYAVETDGTLRWVQSEDQAKSLYGADWNKRIRDIDVSLFGEYRIGDPLAPETFHEGYVGRTADDKAWYVAGNTIRHELTKNGREANHYAAAAFDPAVLFGRADETRPGWSRLATGAAIDGYDQRLNRVGSVGGTAVIAP